MSGGLRAARTERDQNKKMQLSLSAAKAAEERRQLVAAAETQKRLREEFLVRWAARRGGGVPGRTVR
jgi:hypothetical protein